jgi:acyl dehydratase
VLAVPGWRVTGLARPWRGLKANAIEAGHRFGVEARDTVTAAPELVRLTLNVAMAHLDATRAAHGQRLVYGGHTIAIAAAHATRVAPGLVTILGWHAADHTGPVFEGDTLRSKIGVERREPLPGSGELVHLRSHVTAVDREEHVLDWRFVGVMA